MAEKSAIKNYPGVSMFKVKYIMRRGPHKGKERVGGQTTCVKPLGE
jgi:hypothetical protein